MTLLDRKANDRPEKCTALVAMELTKYNIDIAGSINDLEYTFYWSGKPYGERREAGVGFAIKGGMVGKTDRNATSSE